MWDRTVTVGSAGSKALLNAMLVFFTHDSSEMFNATGYRVGWLIAPASVIRPTLAACTRIVYCSNSPLQEAAAAGFEEVAERKFFQRQRKEYAERRQILIDCFDSIGLKYTRPEGTYFILLVSVIISTGVHII